MFLLIYRKTQQNNIKTKISTAQHIKTVLQKAKKYWIVLKSI